MQLVVSGFIQIWANMPLVPLYDLTCPGHGTNVSEGCDGGDILMGLIDRIHNQILH